MDLHVIVDVHRADGITGMKKVVCEIFLDKIAQVATANYEFVDAEVAVDLEDVPEDRLPPTSTIGLGLRWVSSLRRVPSPPARMTAFMELAR